MSQNQILRSLVLNPPYRIDGFTTSPKISKVFSFPYGLRIDSHAFFRSIFQLVFMLSLFMSISCVFLLCFYLPIQNQNVELFNTAKNITNKKLALLVDIQEASSYSKLFSSATSLSLIDAKEIIHINKPTHNVKGFESPITFSKYPSIRFSGF